MNKVNIQIIADKLKISKSTVSRALRNHPDISPATKKKVNQLAESMGYEPNLVAQALTTNKTRTIGVIIPHIGHSFFASALQGMDEVLQDNNYNFLIASSYEDTDRELFNIKTLLSKRVDGLIISVASDTNDYRRFEKLLDRDVPFVFFDRMVPDIPVSSVTIPYEKIYQEKLDYIAKRRLKHIAFIDGEKNSFYSQQKRNAFEKAAAAHGDIKIEKIKASPDVEGGRKALKELIEKGSLPELLDTTASMQAIGVLQEVSDQRLTVPADFELFGNYITSVTELLTPRISGVSFSILDMGKRTAELLLKHIDDKKFQAQEHQVEAKLAFRDTTINKF